MRPRSPHPVLTRTLGAVLLAPAPALADHPGALRSAPMDPLTAGLIAGLLTLAVCALLAVVARILLRRPPP